MPSLHGRGRSALLGLLVLPLLALSACGDSDSSTGAAPGGGTGIDQPVPASIGSLPLRDSAGHVVTLDSLRGKTVVISDSMTLCSEDCPLDTANVDAAARAVDAAGLGDKVEFLTITVDPRRDDARHLRAYRKLYDPHDQVANWDLLTGSPADLAQLWKTFGVFWKKVPEDSPPDTDWLTGKPLTYDIAHSDDVIIIDTSGDERYVIQGHAHVTESSRMPERMKAYLSPEGLRHLNRPGSATWTPDDVLQGLAWVTGEPVTPPSS